MKVKKTRILEILGILLLIYAFLGNYIALPAYLRFLERGGTSEAGNTLDLAVVIGATKTILWMYSFQLGVLMLAIAHSIKNRLYSKTFIVFGLIWLLFWSWPGWSLPGAWFYILFGGLLLILIALVFFNLKSIHQNKVQKSMLVGALCFFAFATWEVCGLGTTGRMLHPEQNTSLSQSILITQSTKLMIEFVLAWSLLLASKINLPGNR